MKSSKQQFLLFSLVSFFVLSYIMVSMYNVITIDGGPWLTFTLGSFIFMFGKSALDIIQEFWGRKQRRQVILISMVLKIVFFVISVWALAVGDASAGAREFFSDVIRVVIAAEVTLFLGQYVLDPYLYSFSAKVLKGKSPLARGALSNVISSLAMTPIQVLIAFYGVRPDNVVMKIAFGKIAIKLPAIFIATIVTAIAIYFIRKTLGLKSLVETDGKDHN